MALDGRGIWDLFSRHRKPLRVFKQVCKRTKSVHLEDSSGSDLPQLSHQHGGSRKAGRQGVGGELVLVDQQHI